MAGSTGEISATAQRFGAKVQRMSSALRHSMSREDFLIWAEGQEGRYEFDGFAPVAMVGGTNNHGIITGNINGQLYLRLRGTPCRPMTADGGGVATVGNAVRYPDATVTCSRPVGTERLLPDPVVVFEVLSRSSKRIDLVEKPIEYRAVASIRRYVIIEQVRAEVRGYVRLDNGDWTQVPPLYAGATLDLPEIGIVLPLAEIYEDVTFGKA